MLKSLTKYFVFFLISLIMPLWAQIPIQKINVDVFPYFEILLSRAKSDLKLAILDDQLNERVAITRFETSGVTLEEKYRTYIIKGFEEVRLENKFFHLVGSIEALNKAVVVNSELELYTSEQRTEMEKFSLDLNADYYAIINISVIDKTLSMTLIIRNARDHKIEWGKKWSTILREGTTSFNLGFYQGITFGGQIFENNMFPIYVHLGIDWKVFTFVDIGFYFDFGANILYPSDSDRNIMGFGFAGGTKFAIDVLNIFNVLYRNVELLLYAKGGINFNYNISHLLPRFQSLPIASITGRPGLGVVINRNYTIFLEFDPIGMGSSEYAVYSGFYYRFEF